MDEFYRMLRESGYCVVFTGAGISTLSGIPDFRGSNGVYSRKFQGFDVEEILSIDLFLRRPDLYYSWAKPFIYELERYQPNVVHRVIARMEALGIVKMTYTQNIDLSAPGRSGWGNCMAARRCTSVSNAGKRLIIRRSPPLSGRAGCRCARSAAGSSNRGSSFTGSRLIPDCLTVRKPICAAPIFCWCSEAA